MSNFSKNFLNRSPLRLLLTWRVFRAIDDSRPVTLLAIMNASLTKAIVFDPAFAVDEHAHFQSLLFTHSRHSLALLKKCDLGVIFADFFACKT